MSEIFRRRLTVRLPGLDRTLEDFPLLVMLEDPTLRSVAHGGRVNSERGEGFGFLDADGRTPLACEVEAYDPAAGALRARVRLPRLSPGAEFYLCCGAGSERVSGSVWEPGHCFVYRSGLSGPSDGLGRTGAFTVEAWTHSEDARVDATQALVSQWALRPEMDAFETFDAGSTGGLNTKGFFGAVFDGRYVYFVPQFNGEERHGQVLRYDTHGGFTEAGSWAAYDAGHTDGLRTKGYYGAVHAGRYVFFVPRTDGNHHHSRILRYDREGAFTDAGSWAAHDAGNSVSYQSAAFDGRYIYFSPGYEDAGGESGRVLRYDTQGDFRAAESYATYNAGNTGGLDVRCCDGACFDGRYVYFAPLSNRGAVLRHDTQGAFGDPASWTALDAKPFGMEMCVGVLFDGRYVHYVPYAHSTVVRCDTQGAFADPGSWTAYEAADTDGLNTRGYDGACFDGRYVYHIPFYEGLDSKRGFHCRVLRFDTQAEFRDSSAWSAADGSALTQPPNPGGFNGGAFDGRYLYFSPWREDPGPDETRPYTPHGKVLRYDTAAPGSALVLQYDACGHNGGLCAARPGPTFTVCAAGGTRTVRADRTLEPGRHHLAGVYDGAQLTLYVDGEAVGRTPCSGAVEPGMREVAVGQFAEGGARFGGTVVEARLSTVARPDAWVRAVYENLRDPAGTVALGEEMGE